MSSIPRQSLLDTPEFNAELDMAEKSYAALTQAKRNSGSSLHHYWDAMQKRVGDATFEFASFSVAEFLHGVNSRVAQELRGASHSSAQQGYFSAGKNAAKHSAKSIISCLEGSFSYFKEVILREGSRHYINWMQTGVSAQTWTIDELSNDAFVNSAGENRSSLRHSIAEEWVMLDQEDKEESAILHEDVPDIGVTLSPVEPDASSLPLNSLLKRHHISSPVFTGGYSISLIKAAKGVQAGQQLKYRECLLNNISDTANRIYSMSRIWNEVKFIGFQAVEVFLCAVFEDNLQYSNVIGAAYPHESAALHSVMRDGIVSGHVIDDKALLLAVQADALEQQLPSCQTKERSVVEEKGTPQALDHDAIDRYMVRLLWLNLVLSALWDSMNDALAISYVRQSPSYMREMYIYSAVRINNYISNSDYIEWNGEQKVPNISVANPAVKFQLKKQLNEIYNCFDKNAPDTKCSHAKKVRFMEEPEVRLFSSNEAFLNDHEA